MEKSRTLYGTCKTIRDGNSAGVKGENGMNNYDGGWCGGSRHWHLIPFR